MSVTPERSDTTERKSASHTTPGGEIVRCFKTLLENIGTIPTAHQQHALDLVETIRPQTRAGSLHNNLSPVTDGANVTTSRPTSA